ncbi:MAG TPA: amidase [Parvularculaceae bacterium]|nr:amidase [Parvularculaceae bacterium]
MTIETLQDDYGAFCKDGRFVMEGAAAGPLAGLSFAAKDNFDIAGRITGAGDPDWRATHPCVEETSEVISKLLAAGARLVGKTKMDPLAWGSLGINEREGTPINPATPGRIPGGSSSGSASAVGAGLVDFALGTDTACSVRLPAALCGVYGIRPTHGRVSLNGVLPLSPSLDTVGWFARSPMVMRAVGAVLLEGMRAKSRLSRLLLPRNIFALAQVDVVEALSPIIDRLKREFRGADDSPAFEGEEGLDKLWYRVWSVEIREAWAVHGAWIDAVRPRSKILSRERFAAGAHSTPDELEEASRHWRRWEKAVRRLLESDGLLIMPTATDIAPYQDDKETIMSFAHTTLSLMSIAGVAGAPQVTLPAATVEGCPVGLSLIGPRGSDEELLDLAAALMA